MSVGPGSRIQLQITPALSDLILLHNQYQANLSIFDQYIIWRYTIGSGSINRRLIGLPGTNVNQWTYQFFKYYNVKFYGLENIPAPFSK